MHFPHVLQEPDAVTKAGREGIEQPSDLIEPLNIQHLNIFINPIQKLMEHSKSYENMTRHFIKTMKRYNSGSPGYFTEYFVNKKDAL
jgi:hypothetical protein